MRPRFLGRIPIRENQRKRWLLEKKMVLQRKPNRLSQTRKTNGSTERGQLGLWGHEGTFKPLPKADDDDERARLIVVWVVRERKSQGVLAARLHTDFIPSRRSDDPVACPATRLFGQRRKEVGDTVTVNSMPRSYSRSPASTPEILMFSTRQVGTYALYLFW